MPKDKGIKSCLVDCIDGILHEYLSAEVWNFPVEHRVANMQLNSPVEDISLYFFQDAAMLHELLNRLLLKELESLISALEGILFQVDFFILLFICCWKISVLQISRSEMLQSLSCL